MRKPLKEKWCIDKDSLLRLKTPQLKNAKWLYGCTVYGPCVADFATF